MATKPASSAEVQQLREELARLKDYQVTAEQNLQQMGFNLQAALDQGWVSKRAQVRRRRLAKKKAAEDARWAEINADRKWLREQRKLIGMPVKDPTPSPSEAAYRERAAEAAKKETAESLRHRIRRLSHQLLIAAAIGKQFREATMADHSGHVVPGADPAVPRQYRAFDSRSEASLSSTEAMARSFRNWVNKKKAQRFRSRSHTPETAVESGRSTEPEDPSSGSSSESSFTNDEDIPNIAGPAAFRAVVSNSGFTDPDESDFDDDEGFAGLAGLNLDEISDEIITSAYGMLATATQTQGGGDWADSLATTVLQNILQEPYTPPLTVSSLNSPNSNASNTISPIVEKKAKSSQPPITGFNNPADLKQALKAFQTYQEAQQKKQQQQQQQQSPAAAEYESDVSYHGLKTADSDTDADTRGPSHRPPHRPADPDRCIWDTQCWGMNTEDPDDGAWVRRVVASKQPTDGLETGWIPWAEQERRFPHVDARLALHEVFGSGSGVFDAATVDEEVWDPLNRAVAERKGRRAPLRLGPITLHSLSRWTVDEFGAEFPNAPVRQPPIPSDEEKKRPLPSATLFKPAAFKPTITKPVAIKPAATPKPAVTPKPATIIRSVVIPKPAITKPTIARPTPKPLKKNVTFDVNAKMALARGTPSQSTQPSPAVASVQYPLKSPAATSLTKPPHEGAVGASRPSPAAPSPSTPYPQLVGTPTVALWEPEMSSVDEASGDDEDDDDDSDDGDETEDLDERLAAFLDGMRAADRNGNGKRPADGLASAGYKKPRVEVIDISSEEEEDDDDSEEDPMQSVRFDAREGPSGGMRYGARRALDRLGLTSSRRGTLGPYS